MCERGVYVLACVFVVMNLNNQSTDGEGLTLKGILKFLLTKNQLLLRGQVRVKEKTNI